MINQDAPERLRGDPKAAPNATGMFRDENDARSARYMPRRMRPTIPRLLLTLIVIIVLLSAVVLPGWSASRQPAAAVAVFYHPPADSEQAGALLQQGGMAILTRDDAAFKDALPATRGAGPVLQYLLANETSGPAGRRRGGGQCGTYLAYPNNLSGIAGDFCAALDGDERNFLHNARGERLFSTQSWQDGRATRRATLYVMNPAAPGWRAYAATGIRQQVEQGAYDGAFLDNVDLSLTRATETAENADGQVAEYQTEEAYRVAVAGFLASVRQATGGRVPLWANLTDGQDRADDWDAYLPRLDGVMEEFFAARWDGTFASGAAWESQLRRAEQAVQAGKGLILVGQGPREDVERMRFALGSYLLVKGSGSYFRYAESEQYEELWTYPDYSPRLGAPLGGRYPAGEGVWQRDFTCGKVRVDVAARRATLGRTPSWPPSCWFG